MVFVCQVLMTEKKMVLHIIIKFRHGAHLRNKLHEICFTQCQTSGRYVAKNIHCKKYIVFHESNKPINCVTLV